MATPGTATPKPLVDPGQLGTAVGTLYTVPASTTTQLTSLVLVNSSGTPTAAGVFLVPSGGTAGVANVFCKDFSVPGDGLPYELVQSQQLYIETSATIQGTAAAASIVTYHISGVELV